MGGDVGGSKKPKSEPNVVPLCDILLVLLIIFMVITPILKKGANVALPEATNVIDQPESGEMITVYIQKDGSLYLKDKQMNNLSELTPAIEDLLAEEKTKTESKVLLRADSEVAYGRVTEVMDAIRKAQIETVGLVTSLMTSDQ